MFHTQVRLPDGERLTTDQWQYVADVIETKPRDSPAQPRRLCSMSTKQSGDTHMHVGWSVSTERIHDRQPLAFFKLRLKEVCRELESELGFERRSEMIANDRRWPNPR